MTHDELRDFFYYELNQYFNDPKNFRNPVKNKKYDFKKIKSKLIRLQNKKSPYPDNYITEIKLTIGDFMFMGYKINNDPKYSGITAEYNNSLKIVGKMISRIARLEADQFEDYCTKVNTDIHEVFNVPACKEQYRYQDIVYVIRNFYIPEGIKSKIRELIPKDPKDEYPKARKMKRHFLIHVGLTNTGKTYHSLERLKEAKSGVYLGPLRLLALEVQENLNTSGVPCNLLTGEEEDIVEGAQHVASTVEKLDIGKEYDVAVIDECQLVKDSERGFAWSRAILGVQSPEIHCAVAPEGLDILLKMIKSCNDTYEVIKHERQTKLIYDSSKYLIPKSIQPGDALIVFSRKEALFLGDYLTNEGIPTSVIYGALPYAARKKQLERFTSGKTKVVVSTDAIGMGLNLPIRRIIFVSETKFDGTDVRPLDCCEVKQIAGRAGRIGMYPEGYVLTMGRNGYIKYGLETPTPDVKKAFIGFADSIAEIDGDLIKILKVWRSIATLDSYRKMDISRYIDLDAVLKQLFAITGVTPSKADELKFLNIPFDEKNADVLDTWKKYVIMYLKGKDTIPLPAYRNKKSLFEYETSYKCLDLYYSFCKNFGYVIDADALKAAKEFTTNKINELLLNTLSTNGKKNYLNSKNNGRRNNNRHKKRK